MCAAGKPAVLIPFPQATDDHQRKNAQVMVAAGAARMLVEVDVSDRILLEALGDLLQNSSKLSEMGANAKALAKPHAAADIADMVARLAKPG